MGSQALRSDFDIDEEDRFFISGVEQVGRSRNTYEHQLRKRKWLVGALVTIGSLGLVTLILGLAWGLGRRKLDYTCPRSYDASTADLVFYVIGDWGRGGNENQQKVARLMADVGACMPPKFIISTGDNFYPNGLSSASDPQFSQSFSSVYSAPQLQGVPWYAVMGNHDYGDAVDKAQLSACLTSPTSPEQCAGKCCISPWWQVVPELAQRDPRWNATMGNVVTRRFQLGAGAFGSETGVATGNTTSNNTLDILFMDTVPFIYTYSERNWANFLYGFNSQNADVIRSQLESQLNASLTRGSRWRLVVGHHPIRSYGSHCSQAGSTDCSAMSFAVPYLQRYHVAAYVNGHDHDQQLIKAEDDPVHYVVSGAGSDTRAGEFDGLDAEARSRDALFLSDKQGFLAVVVAGDVMRLHFYTTGQSGPTYTRSVTRPAAP